MKKAIFWIVLIIIIIIGAVALGNGDKTDDKVLDETGPIKIGVSLPLTGEAASIAEGMVGAIELVMQDVNNAGGIDGRMIDLIIEDDACSDDGINTFNKLVHVDKVIAILGPLCSPAAGPGLPVAQEAGVPTIFWGSAPSLTSVGNYVFRSYPSDSLQGSAAAEYIFNDLGARSVATLHVNNDWGVGITNVFTEKFEELGGTVVIGESVLQTSIDIRTELTKIQEKNPEAIFMPLFPQTGVIALKQIKEIGIDIPIIAGDAFDSSEIALLPEAEGVVMIKSKINEDQAVYDRIAEVTGKKTGNFTVYGHDAANIILDAIREVGTDQEKIRDYLDDLEYTDGIANVVISFDEIGDLEGGESQVFMFKAGELVVVE